MTFPSFLKSTNMKHLLKTLANTHRVDPSPFYILTLPKTHSISPRPDFLFLNRALSNAALQAHPGRFSIWSPQHLRRLQATAIHGLQDKVLITNPYKSEEFIAQALASSIKSMVVSSQQEFQKIEKVKNSHFRYKNKEINYYWAYSDEPEEMENLKHLKEVIRNVVFDWREIRSSPRIDELTRNIIEMGVSLESVICSGGKSDAEELESWSQQKLQQRSRRIVKQVEIKDVSDAENYFLAARSNGRGPLGIHQAAQELIDVSKCDRESVVVQLEKEEWLLSKISKFPLEEQQFLYEMDPKPENKEFEINQPSII